MSAQSDARSELTTILQGLNLTVRDNPVNVNPWCVVIASADPVLTNNNTMGTTGQFLYHLLLQCVGGSPETSSLPALEDMVENVILALGDSANWFPGDASAPFIGEGGSGTYLTITVPATKYIDLTEGV